MSQFPDPVGRKKAAELWSRLLDTSKSKPPSSLMALSKVLQDLAEEFDKRVRSTWASDLYSLAWCNYFVAAFDRPTDISSSDTTFKVDTQGDYKARIVKEGTTTTLEFLLNGPATATVQVHRGTLNQLIGEGSSRSAYVPSVGIPASVAGSTATATGSITREIEEEKTNQKEESDEDVGYSLWD
ncbi:hypothetical protein NEUTE1DRAFT_106753 [Neurospora tetrasperma FGSC 2508]|uniref:Uncharacterized protein n=1 Tax=Neurospora tetrasperma (strain FGSC 2508 / ATCC MYA-4615 / P0657) TaxID=510951 RepID=F8MAH2_NEUT8|nr:uncharacterized protein NEUTE1DRAFT_106753 [Neurospora tetrasperma FGSC 2508]EGO60093.1 hypothetical protein NEUTE1DRAFT_106753 [Neurospora tetrasperma FGSC 2508]EGZ75956.1 hypothetical protein NEUTE2DRAFT_126898 [Neurospora tetrasperma FGSC 2509]